MQQDTTWGKSTSQEAQLQGVPWSNEILTGEPHFAGGRGICPQLKHPFPQSLQGVHAGTSPP